ncbi:hypothetical protein [Spirosoma aerophilum]
MRTNLIKYKTGYLAITVLMACSLTSLETSAMASRYAYTIESPSGKSTVIDTQARPVNAEKTAVLVRNSPTKPEPTAATTASKAKNVEEKKTISRCWKRLMNMAREIRHAHSKTTK